MPQGDGPAQSCFTWVNWDQYAHTDSCKKNYGLDPKYNWALDYFGGRDVAADFEKSSNIIWSNGDVDPWSGGGIMTNSTVKNIALVIKDGAHHYDLREPNVNDTESVQSARATEEFYLLKWIEEYQYQKLWINN